MESWKPKPGDGGTYCSDACGRGCTQAEFDRATQLATDLAKQLGDGWLPNVWENLGWFAKAVSVDGSMDVRPPENNGRNNDLYCAFFDDYRWSGYGPTPQDAVQAALQKAKEEVLEINSLIEGFQKVTDGGVTE